MMSIDDTSVLATTCSNVAISGFHMSTSDPPSILPQMADWNVRLALILEVVSTAAAKSWCDTSLGISLSYHADGRWNVYVCQYSYLSQWQRVATPDSGSVSASQMIKLWSRSSSRAIPTEVLVVTTTMLWWSCNPAVLCCLPGLIGRHAWFRHEHAPRKCAPNGARALCDFLDCCCRPSVCTWMPQPTRQLLRMVASKVPCKRLSICMECLETPDEDDDEEEETLKLRII